MNRTRIRPAIGFPSPSTAGSTIFCWTFAARSAGKRALRNAALSYLAFLAGDETGEGARLAAQYRDADNMTDRIAALRLLVDIAGAERDAALADFEKRFGGDMLVMDKWLTLQAISTLPDTLSRVAALMHHPVFSLERPNKVRALIGAFTSSNPLRYHAVDGAGYAFHADRTLELDPINPQVAARLLAPLGRWRSRHIRSTSTPYVRRLLLM